MVEYNSIQPVSNPTFMLETLGRKISNGVELRISDRLMAMTMASRQGRDYYGPGPAEMKVAKAELPENIKGVLASYAG